MKWMGNILAVYLVLLAAVPCCAFDRCTDEKATASANHEKGDKDCGNCSPFFNCEGCATATIVYEPFSFEITAIKASPVYTNYIQAALPQVNIEFWQPPKLG